MRRRIHIIKYVAANNTDEARQLIVRYGLTPAKNYGDLLRKLKYILKAHGEKGLQDLAAIHPDKDLILSYEVKEESSNACGCGGHSSANGDENLSAPPRTAQVTTQPATTTNGTPTRRQQIDKYAPYAAVAAVTLVVAAIFIKR